MASTNNHLSPSMDKDIKVDFSPESSQHDFITSTEPLAKLSDPREGSPISSGGSYWRSIVKELLKNWKLLVIVLTPILLSPLLVAQQPNEQIAKCLYILILMATYWCTEALPLPATALIPMFLSPAIGLLGAKVIAINYITDLNFLFVAGLIFAVAIEKWNLHIRIALRVLMLVGTRPKMLLLGFISVTGFLSMWLSNTATTAMMIPIAHAVVIEMWKQKKHENENEYPLEPQNEENGVAVSEAPPTSAKEGEEELKPSEMSPKFQNLGKAVSLSICYAANIGGTGTLTGTGPNLLIGDTMSKYFPESDDITFGSWILFSLPLMIICLFICWVILVIMFLGPRTLFCRENDAEFENEGGKLVLKREYQKLGKTSCPEIILITFFVILVLLWLFRDPKFMPGWSSAFEPKFVTDAATGLFICTLLFVFPSSFPGISGHKSGLQLGPPILDWPTVQKKLPWGVIILLGGGFALADMCKKSGLSDWLGCKLGVLDSIPPSALVFICGVVMTFFTEFTSNTSSASIFLPILAQLAATIGVHPLYILVPVTICASFAFAFPVATPPNAIVFAFGHLKVLDMVKSGMLMNFLCLGACMLAINTWGTAYFKLNTFPDWANITTTSQCT